MAENKWAGWVAIIALIIAVVALVFVLSKTMTGNAVSNPTVLVDEESYSIKATGFKTEMGVDKVTIQYRRDGAFVNAKTDAKNGDIITIGKVQFGISNISVRDQRVMLTGLTGNSFMRPIYPSLTFTANTDNFVVVSKYGG